MTKSDREYLQQKKITEATIWDCLATCEQVISKNAYLEKKWSNYYRYENVQIDSTYYYERLRWMQYREKIRSLLVHRYPMNKIIQMTKGCATKASQRAVIEMVELIDTGDYTLL